jgi:acyl-coenzyme A synthetase/AMP-(fatty) acid ligase
VLELLLPLTTGGTVVLATREEAGDGARLRALLEDRRITLMQATPATWRMLRDAGWQGTRGLKVLVGGEALPADLAETLVARAGAVWNMYGPTETTVWSTVGQVRAGARVTIGRPIGNTRVYVLGPERQPVPVGVTGELWIGGAGLARGYFGQAGLTAERFVADPFVAGNLMYRTGDLARWTAAGELEHLGRVDAQVKVRGFRIELGEVETALQALPEVRQAAAVAVTGEGGDTRLIGCVVPPAGATVDGPALRQALRGMLPDYMVPSAIVAVERLPQTANGKLDRRTLAAEADQAARSARVAGGEPLSTATETRLAAIWCELLNVSYVGRHDDFFMLGGHSLLATRLISHIRDAFMTELPMTAVFSEPVLSDMAAHLDGLSTVMTLTAAGQADRDREELEF